MKEETNRHRRWQQDDASLLPAALMPPDADADGARARTARAMPPDDPVHAVLGAELPRSALQRRRAAALPVAGPVLTNPRVDADARPLVGDDLVPQDLAPQDPAQQIVGLDVLLAHVKPLKAILRISPITALGTSPTWWIPNDRETVVGTDLRAVAVVPTDDVSIPLDACIQGAWNVTAWTGEGTVFLTRRGDEDLWVAVAPGSLRLIRGRGARVLMEAYRQEHPAVAGRVFARHGRRRGALMTPVAHHLPLVVTCRRAWGLSAGCVDELPSTRFFDDAVRMVVDALHATAVDDETWLLGAQANSQDIVAVTDGRPALLTTANGEFHAVMLSRRARERLEQRGLLRENPS